MPSRSLFIFSLTISFGLSVTAAPDTSVNSAAIREVEQKAKINKFKISLRLKNEPESYYYEMLNIKIINPLTGILIQNIALGGNPNSGSVNMDNSEIITAIDANYDGYHDLQLIYENGGTHGHQLYKIFLFNPEVGKFEYSPKLSGLPNVMFHRNGKISSWFSSGCCNRSEETYRHVNGKLILINSREEYANSKWFIYKTCNRKNGMLKCSSTRAPIK